MSTTLGLPPLVLERPRIASSDAVRERLPYVDGLRALALVGIVAYYVITLVPSILGPGREPFAQLLRGAGSHGIELFFVLSGFCLAYPVLAILRSDRRVGFDAARYTARRLLRIVPPYYAALALLVVPPLIAAKLGHPLPAVGEATAPTDILKQILFLDGGTRFVNPSFWRLCLQARWYVVFPFAVALWIKSPRAFCVLGAGVAIAASFTQARSLDIAFLPAFLLGIVAADLRVQPLRFQGLVAILLPILVIAAAAVDLSGSRSIVYAMTVPPGFVIQTNLLWQLAAFTAIVAAGELRSLERILSWRPLGFVAAMAYSAFLIFEPALAALLRVPHARLSDPVATALAVLGAFAASVVFWRLIARYFDATSAFRLEVIDAASPGLERVLRFAGIPSSVVLSDVALSEFPNPEHVASREAAEEFSRDETARRERDRMERRAAEERHRQEAVEARRFKAEERVRSVHEEADRREAAIRARKEREEAERLAAEQRAAEQRAAEEKARKEREDAERLAAEQRAAEQRAAEEKARKEREEAERLAAEERARKEREEAERRAAEERGRKALEETERRAAEERARKALEEAERRAAEERAREEREEAERRAAEERALKEREEAERRAAEERARKEREEAERRAAEQRAAEERARKEREEAERRAAEERARKERAEAERRAGEQRAAEERARKEREEAERRAAEERARKAREEAKRRAAEQRAAEEHARKELEAEAMRRSTEEAKRREIEELERRAAERRAVEVEAARKRIEADWRAAQERSQALRSEAEAQAIGSDRSNAGGPAWAQRLLERLGRRAMPPEPELPQFSVAERISRDFGAIESSTTGPSPVPDGEGATPTP